MIAMFSIALLSSASAYVVDMETTRIAYSNCLTDFTGVHLDQKTTVGAFRKAAEKACPAERDAMIAAIKKDELDFGSTAKEATEYATEEAYGVVQSFTDGYDGYLNSGTKPVKS